MHGRLEKSNIHMQMFIHLAKSELIITIMIIIIISIECHRGSQEADVSAPNGAWRKRGQCQRRRRRLEM